MSFARGIRLSSFTGFTRMVLTNNCSQSSYKGIRFYSSDHENESYEAFTERYVKFFDGVDDQFELKRGLNNCFAYDLVPAPSVIEASLRAARRVNDFSTAVRIFEGIKQKVENSNQYNQYLEELKPIKDELGIMTKEELGF
ncbi:cox5a-domain-containing protein [Gigaspora margarita]|uniref:Cytochrome c oxidase subunit 6, mitochondrial n=1 Tax=Gigaspora margarita TaxID=4874 RepID=A0A8H3X1P1_GIGMA|nr:cox5a-domain-containing protein [Gigaspora margarita]